MPSFRSHRATLLGVAAALICSFAARLSASPDSVVVFHEIHYHPVADGGPEWVELHNQMSTRVDLGKWSLRGGIAFEFPEGTVMEAGAFLVVSATAGTPAGALGPFTGSLNNAGDSLRLHERHGRMMDRITYGDTHPWPEAADGQGFTLAKRDPDLGSVRPANWTASAETGGTPGAANFPAPAPAAALALIARGSPWRYTQAVPTPEWNTLEFDATAWLSGEAPVGTAGSLSGGGDPPTVVPPQPRLFLRRVFGNVSPETGGELVLFGDLRGHAEVFLNGEAAGTATGDGTLALRFPSAAMRYGANVLAVEVTPVAGSQDVLFDAELQRVSGGVLVDAAPPHVAGEVVINEILYHHRPRYEDPARGVAYAEDPSEFVELLNRSEEAVELSGWRLRGGADYDFPAGTTLAPGAFLVVDDSQLSGSLANGGDTVRLRRADGSLVDEVTYFDSGRWPEEADGHGASLELIDPDADNTKGESWAATGNGGELPWETISYRAFGKEVAGSNNPSNWREFLMGFLDAGEAFIDDVSVIEDPDGAAVQVIQNGGFQGGAVGSQPAHWRILGTHKLSRIEDDPLAPGNKVLRLVATAEIEHTYNVASTTFAGNRPIRADREYLISFRARWIAGSPQLNTRLYLNRAARTHILAQPAVTGTPGAANRARVANAGPTFDGLRHEPTVPSRNERIRVSVAAGDPDAVSAVELRYAVNGGAWRTTPMAGDASGRYLGFIPGQNEGAVVQFHIRARDGAGAQADFPAGGEASRALVRVGKAGASGAGVRNHFQLIMLPTEAESMHTPIHGVSNFRWGATAIYNDREIYYDVGVRLRGAPYGRQGRPGWNIRFGDEHPFRGVHASAVIDAALNMPRGDGTGWITTTTGASINEMLYNVVANRAGGVPATYDDIVFFAAPRARDNSIGQLKMMRFGNGYLEEIAERGDEGAFFKQELIYYPTATVDGNPESLKNPYNMVTQVDITDMGDAKDSYRFNYLPQNQAQRDDFSGIIAMAKAFSAPAGQLRARTDAVLDVDNWMRVLAFNALFGVADSYNNGLAHNFAFFQRPADGKMMAFPWDLDHAGYYATNANIFGQGTHRVRDVIAIPANRRRYCGHLLDFCETGFDNAYAAPWIANLMAVAGQPWTTNFTNWISQRRAFVLSELNRLHPPETFRVTTNGGNPFATAGTTVTLEGQGWIDVDTISVAGGGSLAVLWLDGDTWRVTVPLAAGANVVALTARNRQGEPVGGATITVTNTGGIEAASAANLVVGEIMYHPAPPTASEILAGFGDADDFEFLELENIGANTVDLGGVTFTNGIPFTFAGAAIRQLAPGARVLVVRNRAAFEARYGAGLPVAGAYGDPGDPSGEGGPRLSDGGERLRLADAAGGTIRDFTYDDKAPWPEAADGSGYALTLVRPFSNPDHALAASWRASAAAGGSPGASDATDLATWLAARGATDPDDDPDGDGLSHFLTYGLGADLAGRASLPALTVEPDGRVLLAFRVRAGADDIAATPEVSESLADWRRDPGDGSLVAFVDANPNGDGTLTVRYRLAASVAAAARVFVRVVLDAR